MNCFIADPDKNADVAASATTQDIHSIYVDVFSSIGCFKGTCSLQAKEGVKPYQASPMHVT